MPTPKEAAQQLGVSEATLRRMARFYEAAFGEIPNDSRGRVYPDEAIKRMISARELMDERRASNLEQAFQVLASGDGDALQPLVSSPTHVLNQEVQSLRHQLATQQMMLEEVLDRLGRILEENAVMKEQMNALTAPSDTLTSKDAYVAEMERVHAETERARLERELQEERTRTDQLRKELEQEIVEVRILFEDAERRREAVERKEQLRASRPWWRRVFG